MFEFVNIVNMVLSSYLAVIFSLLLIWIAKRHYDAKLRNPAKMYFLIPDLRYKLSYAEQDEEEHLVKELVLPSNMESQVFIWFKPKVNYYEEEHYFGCKNRKGGLTVKPRVIKYSNPFILEENLEKSYYIDWHYDYHLRTGRNRLKNEVYVGGFIVKTFEEGEYLAEISVHTPTKLGIMRLKLKVISTPSARALCLKYKQEKRIRRLLRKGHKKHYVRFHYSPVKNKPKD